MEQSIRFSSNSVGITKMASGWQNKQLQNARRTKRDNRIPLPLGPTEFTKEEFINAIPGTWGNLLSISKNLGVIRQTVVRYLKKEDWSDVREMVLEEEDAAADESLESVKASIKNKNPLIDYSNATLNARWYLERRRRNKFGNESKTIVEGGINPIRVNAVTIPVEALNLPVELKRKLLEHVDQQEQIEIEHQAQIEREQRS